VSGGVERFREDEEREETFTFTAAPLSWKPFAAELFEYARINGLDLEYTRERGRFLGLLGVELVFTVRGPYSAVTDFADFARRRMALWRDGSVAPGGGGP